jgi:WD40 repeat protein
LAAHGARGCGRHLDMQGGGSSLPTAETGHAHMRCAVCKFHPPRFLDESASPYDARSWWLITRRGCFQPLGLNLDGSTDVRAVAHSGSVTGLVASPDCLHLLSSGTDSRLRLWDSMTGDHLLVHYADTYNRASKPRRFCVGADGKVLYNPSGSVIQVWAFVGPSDDRQPTIPVF